MHLLDLLFITAPGLWFLMPIACYLPISFDLDLNLTASGEHPAGKTSRP